MEKKYYIAHVTRGDGFNFISKRIKIEEILFYAILSDKVKVFTSDLPDKYNETFDKVIECLKTTNVTVDNINFEIKGK